MSLADSLPDVIHIRATDSDPFCMWARRGGRRGGMPKFPENGFISTPEGQGLLTDMISLRWRKTEHFILRLSDPAGARFQTPWFAPPPLRTANDCDDGAPGRTSPFIRGDGRGRLKLIGGDGPAAPRPVKMMTSLQWGNFVRRRCVGYRSWQVAPLRCAAMWVSEVSSLSHHNSVFQHFISFWGSNRE